MVLMLTACTWPQERQCLGWSSCWKDPRGQRNSVLRCVQAQQSGCCRDFEGVQKDNEKAVSEMKQLAESFEKEVTEEGELEPSARCVGSNHMRKVRREETNPRILARSTAQFLCEGRCSVVAILILSSLVSQANATGNIQLFCLSWQLMRAFSGAEMTSRVSRCAGRSLGWGRWMRRSTWTCSSTS